MTYYASLRRLLVQERTVDRLEAGPVVRHPSRGVELCVDEDGGCDVGRHDPVSVVGSADPGGAPDARYCNYGCLAAHIEAAELTIGTTCEWSPS